MTERDVTRLVRGMPTSDGAGVKLVRVLGTRMLPELDPFLMLDEFRSDDPTDYLAGFPNHPHRGFETVTYMLAGRMEHGDSLGNRGDLGPGDVQWMTAGRGIVHSEFPRQNDGLMWGFQLWINLPAAQKMVAPRYQDIPAAAIPTVEVAGAAVRVVAGTFAGVEGPVSGIATRPTLLDVAVSGPSVEVPLQRGQTAFAYVFEGTARIGRLEVERGNLAVLSDGDTLALAGGPGRVLVLAANPLKEPIARHGPFVMNTQRELEVAFDDYRSGRLGR